MDSLSNLTYSEDALLEEYEESMEVEGAAVMTVPVPPTIDVVETPSLSSNDDINIIPSSMEATNFVAPSSNDDTINGPSLMEATIFVAPSSNDDKNTPPSVVTTSSNPGLVPGATEASGSNNANSHLPNCRICNKKHNLFSCSTFKKMTNEKRIRMVLLHRYCSRCFSPQHLTRDCKSAGKCKTCKGRHHTMLHSTKHSAAKMTKDNPRNRSSVVPTNTGLPLRPCITFSPTARVLLKCGNKSIPLRAAIDLCCTKSYICESLAKDLRLSTFSVNSDKFSRLNICSIYESSEVLQLIVKITKMQGIVTPIESVPDSIKESFQGLQLADPNFNISGRVALVIGPEVAHQTMKGRIYSNPGLPLAQYTIFGWVISGQSSL